MNTREEWPKLDQSQEKNYETIGFLKSNEKFFEKLKDFGILDLDFIKEILNTGKIESFDIVDDDNIEIRYKKGELIGIQRQKIYKTNQETDEKTEEIVFRIIRPVKQSINERNFKSENINYDNVRANERYENKFGVYKKDDE